MSKPLKTGLFALLVGMAVLFSGFLKQEDIYFQIRKNLSIFSELYKEVSILYIDEIPPAELIEAGIDAMLEKLDPYSVFIAEGEQSRMEIMSSGSFGGIGLDAGFRGEELVVIAPLEGYPAERAGVRPGDIVVAVDGISAEDLTVEEFQNVMLGDIGSILELVLYRPAIGKEIRFELTREKIEAKNVTYTGRLGPNEEILYIQLAQFGQQSAEEIRSAILGGDDGDTVLPEPQGLILDLRNNPGGLLNEAVEIVDKFIEPGVTVVETLGRNPSQNNIYPTREPVMFEDLPIVILINEGSASASEIVSGALQDLDRAVILGRTSFGKGLVQTIRPLPYNTSLKLTVSEYTIPSGRRIQAIRYGDERNTGADVDTSADTDTGADVNTGTSTGTDTGEGAGTGAYSESRQAARAFKTKNGRTVYDGNGIKPDVEMPEENTSQVETALLQDNHFFFFVNRVLAETEALQASDSPEEKSELSAESLPEVDEELFVRFLEYLEAVNFDFRTPADEAIAELKNRSEYFSDEAELERQVNQLIELSENYKRAELRNSRAFIVRHIERQLVSQSRGRSAEQQFLLENDLWIDTALEMIRNRDNYRSILTP
ncbi:MAG: S41 family peptidase [Balneolaceae bacterium]